jgi:hypothetical protein
LRSRATKAFPPLLLAIWTVKELDAMTDTSQ